MKHLLIIYLIVMKWLSNVKKGILNMRKIIGIIHPFDIYQTFYVYENGNKLQIVKTRVKDIVDTILQLSQTYNVQQVDLSGAKHYIKGLIKQTQEAEMLKYNQNKLKIRCI